MVGESLAGAEEFLLGAVYELRHRASETAQFLLRQGFFGVILGVFQVFRIFRIFEVFRTFDAEKFERRIGDFARFFEFFEENTAFLRRFG